MLFCIDATTTPTGILIMLKNNMLADELLCYYGKVSLITHQYQPRIKQVVKLFLHFTSSVVSK